MGAASLSVMSRVAPQSPSLRLPALIPNANGSSMHKWFSSTRQGAPALSMTPGKGSGITNENTMGQGLPLYFSGTGRGHVSIDLSAILAACQHKSKDLHVKFVVSDRWEIFGELIEPAVAPPPADSSETSKFSLNCRFSTED